MKTLLLVVVVALFVSAQPAAPRIQSGDFLVTYDDRGVTGIANPGDRFGAQVLAYALAKYGATHDMPPDGNLWFDKNKNRWYSHPAVRREDSRAFMDRQLQAGLAVRGWMEAAYYLLGSDFTGSSDSGSLSYMAKMGGWGILDYGINFATEPWDWLQLGYASYLSSWALMNTGRPDTNYGFWFPGPENDGASGWQFTTSKWARGWIRKEMPRGPWHYDGEIDLGYGAGIRMATTLVAQDPIFGLVAYGGALSSRAGGFGVVPRDGLRQRFCVMLAGSAVRAAGGQASSGPARKLRLELDRDGFTAGAPVSFDGELRRVAFTLENRTGEPHQTTLRLSLPEGRRYEVRQDGQVVALRPTGNFDYPQAALLRVKTASSRVEILGR
ncbi:MAG: hypothetical protein EHM24_10705 [Acidobacteria bacterium]|nr:MAG: hypothetical protein EHM24_10705 [Acidobacteriota bacterium]